jgi:hypothetical protein
MVPRSTGSAAARAIVPGGHCIGIENDLFQRSPQGKFVTFGVTRGCIEVASPVSSITWLIPP